MCPSYPCNIVSKKDNPNPILVINNGPEIQPVIAIFGYPNLVNAIFAKISIIIRIYMIMKLDNIYITWNTISNT